MNAKQQQVIIIDSDSNDEDEVIIIDSTSPASVYDDAVEVFPSSTGRNSTPPTVKETPIVADNIPTDTNDPPTATDDKSIHTPTPTRNGRVLRKTQEEPTASLTDEKSNWLSPRALRHTRTFTNIGPIWTSSPTVNDFDVLASRMQPTPSSHTKLGHFRDGRYTQVDTPKEASPSKAPNRKTTGFETTHHVDKSPTPCVKKKKLETQKQPVERSILSRKVVHQRIGDQAVKKKGTRKRRKRATWYSTKKRKKKAPAKSRPSDAVPLPRNSIVIYNDPENPETGYLCLAYELGGDKTLFRYAGLEFKSALSYIVYAMAWDFNLKSVDDAQALRVAHHNEQAQYLHQQLRTGIWHEVIFEMAARANYLKFSSEPWLKRRLVETGDKVLIAAKDGGEDLERRTWPGQALMWTRRKLVECGDEENELVMPKEIKQADVLVGRPVQKIF